MAHITFLLESTALYKVCKIWSNLPLMIHDDDEHQLYNEEKFYLYLGYIV